MLNLNKAFVFDAGSAFICLPFLVVVGCLAADFRPG